MPREAVWMSGCAECKKLGFVAKSLVNQGVMRYFETGCYIL